MIEVVAGVDIGGTNTVYGIVDKSGNIIGEGRLSTVAYPDINDFVSALHNAVSELISADSGLVLKGVGIGAPNANYHKGTIELAPNLAWKGIVPLADLIRKKLDCIVAITNDANAAAMGEMIFGAAKSIKDFIILTLGTGLGSGIVINGELVYGHTGFAGELGHMIIEPGGRECGCGRRGCLETYGSATGIVRTVLQLMSEDRDESPLRSIAPAELTSRDIAEAAGKKDPIALKAFDFTAQKIAHGIVNSVIFSSPRTIFLFGGLAKAGDILFDPVRKYVDRDIQPVFRGTVEILPSGIPENNAAVLGAAALAWNEISR